MEVELIPAPSTRPILPARPDPEWFEAHGARVVRQGRRGIRLRLPPAHEHAWEWKGKPHDTLDLLIPHQGTPKIIRPVPAHDHLLRQWWEASLTIWAMDPETTRAARSASPQTLPEANRAWAGAFLARHRIPASALTPDGSPPYFNGQMTSVVLPQDTPEEAARRAIREQMPLRPTEFSLPGPVPELDYDPRTNRYRLEASWLDRGEVARLIRETGGEFPPEHPWNHVHELIRRLDPETLRAFASPEVRWRIFRDALVARGLRPVHRRAVPGCPACAKARKLPPEERLELARWFEQVPGGENR